MRHRATPSSRPALINISDEGSGVLLVVVSEYPTLYDPRLS